MDKANVQVKRMSNMINGFLNISRLESGKMQLVKQSFQLDELLKEVIKENELTTTSHIIHTNICDQVLINADRDKISSVISNLLNNAVKYSPKGKNIYVTCELTPTYARINIRDEGPGIEASDKEHLFERYYRAESSKTRYISGFGIGLYLSAEIVERHQGQIGVDSEPGHGSTFWFTLPVQT
jgi:signal transduction histidine kinase